MTVEQNTQPIEVLTIGHSTRPYDVFVRVLRLANVTAIADVRSSPHSGRFPQFNQESLSTDLRRDGIAYVYLGNELGGRPKGKHYYRDGVADYERMSKRPEFAGGIDRIIDGAKKHRIALMCSERNPLDCHRCLLVGRALVECGIRVSHILDEGQIMEHSKIEDKLLNLSGSDNDDLFASRVERLATAYREQARKVAYSRPQPNRSGPVAAE